MEKAEVNFLEIKIEQKYIDFIENVLEECFKEENLNNTKLYVNILLTNSKNIRTINKEHRNIDKETDVLSFPMFEKDEIKNISSENVDVLGDIVISVEQVKKQAEEYEHSFDRELAYMLVHGFYHLMGYDHMNEEDKKEMRSKEENVLNNLKIYRV